MINFNKIKVDDKKNGIKYESKEIYNKLSKYFFLKNFTSFDISFYFISCRGRRRIGRGFVSFLL